MSMLPPSSKGFLILTLSRKVINIVVSIITIDKNYRMAPSHNQQNARLTYPF
jgi:hypothetical protein